ncbi:ensconsin isoform X2 [Neocloeon triangulifer]|uniref:ensconsin isoform X2 n=2 Tax=Neocloeon triangulifer TaxID=2078957 RepID=UPI00286FA644|nr:ensconsin isoform X2 [Neocloeon triangulifer]
MGSLQSRAENTPDTMPSPSGEPTEIRCQEESRGGLRYEVILAEPLTDTPPKPRPVSPQAKTPDIETITEKMVAAEERRKSLEASKLNELKAKMNRIEEAAKKRDEQTQEFINVTKNALDQKMKVHTEKHEEYLGDLISKVKEHLEIVDKHRQSTTESGDKQTEEVRTSLEERLRTASEQREEHLRKQLERLKEHAVSCARVREDQKQKSQKLLIIQEQIQSKLKDAENRKSLHEEKLRVRLIEHEKRCEMARQKREQLLLEGNQPCNEETTVAASSG